MISIYIYISEYKLFPHSLIDITYSLSLIISLSLSLLSRLVPPPEDALNAKMVRSFRERMFEEKKEGSGEREGRVATIKKKEGGSRVADEGERVVRVVVVHLSLISRGREPARRFSSPAYRR